MKRFLVLLLSLLLFVGLFSGCKQESDPNTDSENSVKTEAPSEEVDTDNEISKEKITMQVVCPSNVQDFPEGVTPNDNFIVDYWEQQTGFNFDIVVMSAESDEKFNVMFSSGEISGLAFFRDVSSVSALASQGLIANLDDYMENSTFFQKFASVQVVGVYDGKQYGAVVPSDGIGCQSGELMVRKDIFAEYGITEQIETLDGFTEMLRTAKNNGVEVPLAVYGDPIGSDDTFDTLLAMFTINSGGYYGVRDDKIVFKALLPEAKKYLTYVKMLYDEGLIAKDFAALTADAAQELFMSEKSVATILPYPWGSKNILTQGEELGFDIRFMDYPENINGEKTYGKKYSNYGNASLVGFVSKDCDYVEEVVEFLDFLVLEETAMVNNFGIEGEHYNLENGSPVATEKGGSEISWAVYFRSVFLPESWYPVYGAGAGWAEYYYPSERVGVGNPDFDPILHLPVQGEYVTRLDEMMTTIIQPYFTKVITGEASIDDFDSIAQEWLESDGQEILDFYTDLWIKMGRPTFEYETFLPAYHPEYTGKYLFDGEEGLATQITMDD